MPRKIRSLRPVRLDPFAALKRAFIRRGFIPKKPSELTSPEAAQPAVPSTDTSVDTIPDDTVPETGPAKLIDLTQKAQDVLFQADSVFPFILFPDTVTLDREKLTIAERLFFRMAKITSVPIADILSVEADVGPFFGSVHLKSRYFFTNARSIKFLSRGNAVKLQRLLQGYIIASQRKVDCTTIATKDLKVLLNDLGQGSTD
ncbi:MAG: hypothetical protein Q7R60_00630 [bacterium]|nr:hypothetical protein [bacterium]